MNKRYILPILIIFTILLLIKVYVANELYYTSRNIQKLSIQINALKEERNILKLKIEKLKYKNTIIDPLFNYVPKIETPTVVEDEQATTENENTEQKEPKQEESKKSTKELFETIIVDENGEAF